MDSEEPRPSTYLGFDFSTQQVKALVITDDLKVLQEAAVHFDSELPEFRTQGGVLQGNNGEVTSPVVMWIKAMDLVLDKLRVAGTDFSTVAAVSGSGQQHGSVWWKRGAGEVLMNLDPQKFLHHQLSSSHFSRPNAPIWMDISTELQCQKLEEQIGGAQKLADITGSRAYERFTGNQIARTYSTAPDIYGNTEHISLVSSFACSLMIGQYAPIDYSDGSGMNLLDITTKDWNEECLKACGVGLRSLLGAPVPSNTVVGKVANFYVERYGFRDDCSVVAFTGDNNSSLAAMRLSKGDVALSLGTSDTLFLSLDHPKPGLEGHVFVSPIDPEAYMVLLCFSNGSLTREGVRDKCAEGSWDIFSELLEATPRGNFGNMALFYSVREICPPLLGVHRFNKADERVSRFTSSEVEVRALVEGQMLSRRLHANRLGFTSEKCRVMATGGASCNKSLLQIAADVFQAPVYTMDVSNSAALGGAYRAKHGIKGGAYEAAVPCPAYTLATKPAPDAAKVYSQMLERLDVFEKKLLSESEAK
ncbi:Carbohydrate kinase FGGY N-terminal [Trinorchestia longiramus]|nr:Carbohydrate kinase FGGY N-terminal [Trinorchestia longiramus]